MADTSFVPPATVQANAKRGLDLRAEHNRGGTEVGVARARDLSNGKHISLDTIKRMNSYFARHEVDKQGEGWGKDSAGYIAWLLWGGDAGWSWVKSILAKQETKDKANMSEELAYSYAPILKYDSNDDGTVTVYGKATDETLDVDQQICDNEWLKSAMPDWFVSAGNIREMHGSTAAGVATDYEEKADGHYITAKIVDDGSVRKVKAGVLKGFSIGIRSPRVIRDAKAAGGRIVGGQIVEVSVVDRPANPSAKMTIAKAMNGESLMAVEQFDIPTPGEVFKTADVEIETAPVEDTVAVVEEAADKSADLLNVVGSLLKYDKATFDAANAALYDLVAIEAGEGKAGSDERHSIRELLQSIEHLYEWYVGEVAEGEVSDVNEELVETVPEELESLTLAADPTCETCGELTMSCKCADKAADPTCETCGELMMACKCADKSATAETLVETTDSVNETPSEVDRLKSALDAEIEKATRLEAELELAKSAVVSGGPRRTGITKAENTNEVLIRMSELRNKAAATTDRVLRKGYEDLAADLSKSLKGQN